MIIIGADTPELEPLYATQFSSCADVRAAMDVTIENGKVELISTGLKIRGVLESNIVPGIIPELQIRSRSGLASKGIMVANGIGTIDVDYRGEILVPLINLSGSDYVITRLDKIAQITLGIRPILPGIKRLEIVRDTGGFGSTDATNK